MPVSQMIRLSHTAFPQRLLLLCLGALLFACANPEGVIFEGPSLFGSIYVEDSAKGLRTLMFERNGARQSVVKLGDPDHLELSYARTVLAGLPLAGKMHRVLVLGLGGGSLPMFLHHNFPEALIEVVEIDPAVVSVAKQFFDVREDEGLRIRLGDARSFVEASAPGFYDLIIVDAFGANSVPAHLSTREFILALRRAVVPEGVVIGNLWRRPFNAAYDSMVLTYLSVFEQNIVLDVPADVNSIVLALPRKAPINREILADMAGELARSRKFRVDLANIVNTAFKQVESMKLDGSVLRDQVIQERPLPR